MIKLANNEQVVKEYAYSKTHEGSFNKRTTQNKLLVTNKRIIKTSVCEKAGREKFEVSEIAVSDVTGIKTKTSSSFKMLYLVLGIIFTLCALVALLVAEGMGKVLLLALALILAIVMFVKFAKSRRNVFECTFIVGERTTEAMFVGATTFNSRFRLAVNTQTAIKVEVDPTVAKEFVSEIGALLINVKEETSQASE